jgi:hypothetical protein
VGDPHVAGISSRNRHVAHESRRTANRVVRHRSHYVLDDLMQEAGLLFSIGDPRRTLLDRRSRGLAYHVPSLDIKVSQTAETTRTGALTGLRYACSDHSTSETLGDR